MRAQSDVGRCGQQASPAVSAHLLPSLGVHLFRWTPHAPGYSIAKGAEKFALTEQQLARFARWPVILAFVGGGITLLYHYGPSREHAKFQWLSWGAVFSTFLWLGASMLFSYYLENFANYNATYGTLGALIGFMVWMWISTIILIVGAILNAELEHQTARDSTIGEPLPMGERGAYVADTLGKTADEN